MTSLKIEIRVTSEIIYQDGHREPGKHITYFDSIAYSKDAGERIIRMQNRILNQLHQRNLGSFGRSFIRLFTEPMVDMRKNIKEKIEYNVSYYAHGQSDDGYTKTINDSFTITKPL
jgi:hypothetical protein